MEGQEDPLSELSETADIKVEQFSECDEDQAEHGPSANEQQDFVQVDIKCEEVEDIPLKKPNKTPGCSVDYEWTCHLCSRMGKDVTKFKHHLSQAHFREELLALWPGELTSPCPHCHKCLISADAKKKKSQIILNHLGSAHNLVLQFLDETFKSELQSRILAQPLGLENVYGEEKFDCLLCSTKFKTHRNMKQHMGWIHFGEIILQESGSTTEQCGQCDFRLTGKNAKPKELVCHLICIHGFLYKVIPEDMAEKLLQLDPTGSDLKEFNISRGVQSEGNLKCPYCHLTLKSYDTVVKHVIQQHLMDDILTMSGYDDTDNCHICGRKFVPSSKETVPQKMVCHLGLVHGYLDKTLSEEAKSELATQRETLKSQGVSLRKHVKRKQTKEPVDSDKKKRKWYKSSQERDEPLPVPDNLKERLVAFDEARTNGALKNEPNVGVKPGYEERAKSFLGGGPKPDDWQCFLCLQTGNNWHQLKTHLATRHFRKQLRFFWPDGDFDNPCPYCHKHVVKKPSIQDGIKAYCAITHLARQHELIKHVCSDDVRKALEELDNVQEALDCPLCQENCKSKTGLESHLILDHYRGEFRNASSSSGGLCGICNEHYSDRRSVLLHAARQHGLMEEIFPKEVLDYLGKTPEGTTVKTETSEDIEQDCVQMNFVDIDSVEVKAEPEQVKVEPATDALEVDADELPRNKQRRFQNEDEELIKQDLSDIIVTDSSIGSFS